MFVIVLVMAFFALQIFGAVSINVTEAASTKSAWSDGETQLANINGTDARQFELEQTAQSQNRSTQTSVANATGTHNAFQTNVAQRNMQATLDQIEQTAAINRATLTRLAITDTPTPTSTPLPICEIRVQDKVVYSTPSTTSNSIDTIVSSTVQVVGYLEDRSWYLVKKDDFQGWITGSGVLLRNCEIQSIRLIDNYDAQSQLLFGETFNDNQNDWSGSSDIFNGRLVFRGSNENSSAQTMPLLPSNYRIEVSLSLDQPGNAVVHSGITIASPTGSYLSFSLGRPGCTVSMIIYSERINFLDDSRSILLPPEADCRLGSDIEHVLTIEQRGDSASLMLDGQLLYSDVKVPAMTDGTISLFLDTKDGSTSQVSFLQIFVWVID